MRFLVIDFILYMRKGKLREVRSNLFRVIGLEMVELGFYLVFEFKFYLYYIMLYYVK